MKFFDRKDELALLRRIREESRDSARMTILKGRRRIGKTSLLQKAYGDASRFNKALLQRKVAEFFTVAGDLAEYKMRCSCLSVDDM